MIKKVIFTRHGQTEWNVIKRIQGQKNSNLTELGIKQSELFAERIKNEKIDVAFVSPLQRTIDTSKIMLKHQENTKVVLDDRIKEITLGIWDGELKSDVIKLYPEIYDTLHYTPEKFYLEKAETIEALRKRTSDFLNDLFDYDFKTALVICHGVTLKSILGILENRSIKNFWSGEHIKWASYTELIIDEDNNKTLSKICDTSHYDIV